MEPQISSDTKTKKQANGSPKKKPQNEDQQKKSEMFEMKDTPLKVDSPGDPKGRVKMSEDVVATIAGIASRDIRGIHKLGKPRFIEFGTDNPTRGVMAEVGTKQAAIDLDVVLEYGANIHKTAETLRTRLAEEIFKMAGRELIEVNINVVDIHVDNENDDNEVVEERRVI